MQDVMWSRFAHSDRIYWAPCCLSGTALELMYVWDGEKYAIYVWGGRLDKMKRTQLLSSRSMWIPNERKSMGIALSLPLLTPTLKLVLSLSKKEKKSGWLDHHNQCGKWCYRDKVQGGTERAVASSAWWAWWRAGFTQHMVVTSSLKKWDGLIKGNEGTMFLANGWICKGLGALETLVFSRNCR